MSAPATRSATSCRDRLHRRNRGSVSAAPSTPVGGIKHHRWPGGLGARPARQVGSPAVVPRVARIVLRDLANRVLTTVLEPTATVLDSHEERALSRPLGRPMVDSPGPAQPPEKRKVGGSTPPLTTTLRPGNWPVTCEISSIRDRVAAAADAPPKPLMTVPRRWVLHVGSTPAGRRNSVKLRLTCADVEAL